LIQRYQLGLSGVVWDPRFASYTATIGFQDSVDRTDPFIGSTTKVNRDTLTYSLQMNLFRVRWPVILYAQRNIINTDTAGNLVTDTYSLNWILSLRNLPTLRVTLLQLGTDFEDENSANSRETRMRLANIGLGYQTDRTNLDFTYQVSNFLVRSPAAETESTVNSYTFRGDSYLRPGLFTHAHLIYFPKGSVFAPGLTTVSETTGGLGVLHQVPRFSQAANYEFFDTSGTDLERHTLAYNANYRPLGKTDYHGNLVYLTSNYPGNDTSEYRLSGGFNHRPFFGLSLTGTVLVNHSESSGLLDTTRDRLGTNVGVNYFRPLTYFHFNSGAAFDYGIVTSDLDAEQGQIWTATALMGLTTRTLQTTQINGTYTFLHREDTVTHTDNRDEHAVHLGILDSTFPRLVLKGGLDLQYTDSKDTGIDGTSVILDTRADYYVLLNLNTAVGFRYSDFPQSSGTQDVKTYFAEGRYLAMLIRNLNMTLLAHWDRDSYDFIERDRYLLSSLLVYQLGKITTSLEYRHEMTKYPQTEYTVESVFVRATRPF
jgi:hypothetical protein